MSSFEKCSHDCKPDWKAYALGELDATARYEAEACAAACATCREELASIRLTLDALSTLREEEIPQRIAFVSDKVFEPRWWQRWMAGLRQPSFAAGVVIAGAILVHAFARPVAVPAGPSITPAAVQAEVAARVEQEVSTRVDAAVAKAVAETEQRQDQKTAALMTAAEKRFSEQRREDFATAAANFDMLRKQVVQMYAVNTGAGIR